jgi:diketogulonate reductase-like aldo/keto reductase
MEFVTLNTGAKMPLEGFGVFQVPDPAVCEQAVYDAIKTGYRLIDTAQAYMNEEAVGKAVHRAIADGIAKREELFITTKVWVSNMKTEDTAYESVKTSLAKLGLDYVDLILLHQPMGDYFAAYTGITRAYKEGLVKAIGVSNFNIDDLMNIMTHAKIRPMVNQIPLLLGNVDKELVSFCNEHSIMVEAYSPLAHGHLIHDKNKELMREEVIKNNPALAKYTWSQLLLSYASTYADIILPKASSKDHMLEDMNYLLNLDQDTVHLLEKLHQELGTPFVFEE